MGGAGTGVGHHHGGICVSILTPIQRVSQVHNMPPNKGAGGIDNFGCLVVRNAEKTGGGRVWWTQGHGGHRGWGQGWNRGGAHILNLRKQETLNTLNVAFSDTN